MAKPVLQGRELRQLAPRALLKGYSFNRPGVAQASSALAGAAPLGGEESRGVAVERDAESRDAVPEPLEVFARLGVHAGIFPQRLAENREQGRRLLVDLMAGSPTARPSGPLRPADDQHPAAALARQGPPRGLLECRLGPRLGVSPPGRPAHWRDSGDRAAGAAGRLGVQTWLPNSISALVECARRARSTASAIAQSIRPAESRPDRAAVGQQPAEGRAVFASRIGSRRRQSRESPRPCSGQCPAKRGPRRRRVEARRHAGRRSTARGAGSRAAVA